MKKYQKINTRPDSIAVSIYRSVLWNRSDNLSKGWFVLMKYFAWCWSRSWSQYLNCKDNKNQVSDYEQ